MKPNELKDGQIAEDKHGAIYKGQTHSISVRYSDVVRTFDREDIHKYCFKDYDLTPLAPQVPLSELKRYTPFIAQTCSRTGECSIQWEQCDDGAAVFYDEVAAVSPVSPVSDERVRELEEKHRNAAVEVETLKNKWGLAQAELSTLRAQLEGQWELGEPLTEGQLSALNGTTQVVSVENTPRVTIEAGQICEYDFAWALGRGTKFYLDPRPLPTLPSEPEPEVPAVPKFLRPEGLLGVFKHHDRYLYAIGLRCKTAINIVEGDDGSTSCYHNNLTKEQLYLGPVLHPDGTTSPIEPTQELKAALKG